MSAAEASEPLTVSLSAHKGHPLLKAAGVLYERADAETAEI